MGESNLVRAGKVSTVVGHHRVQGGRLIDRARRVFLVSNRLKPGLVRKLGYSWADSVQGALEQALKLTGPAARISVLKNAAESFPVAS